MLNPVTDEKPTAAQLKKQVKALVESCKNAAINFYQTANNFAQDVELPEAEKQYANFAKLLEKIVLLAAEKPAKKPEDLMATLKKAKDADSFIKTLATTKPELYEQLACYAIIKSYADAGLSERWAFERKFNEYFNSVGAATYDIRANLSKVFVLAKVADAKLIEKDATKAAFEIVKLLTQGKYASLLSGANRFNDICWFNKEVSDESIALVTAIALLEATAAQTEAVLKEYADLLSAKTKAEYQCGNFIKPFVPKTEAKEKTVKSSKADKAEEKGTKKATKKAKK